MTTLNSNYIEMLKSGSNVPDTILEVTLDGGIEKWGFNSFHSDVLPILSNTSSLQNKLDIKKGYTTRGKLTLTLNSREKINQLITNEYLKNRRIKRKDGFKGLDYSDYVTTFDGIISNVTINSHKDELVLTVADELVKASKKIPVSNATKTQFIDYRNLNPVDIMLDILENQLSVDPSLIDVSVFNSERDSWLSSIIFDRVLTEPKKADEFLSELQSETNSFLIHNGEKITYKVFAPPSPGQVLPQWSELNAIQIDSLSQDLGYSDNFFNRVEILYDYDESGGDNESNFESRVINIDASSQSVSQWDEVRTKTIKSKWIRSHTYTEPVNVTGVTIYHVSNDNGPGTGELNFNYVTQMLKWKSPSGSFGAELKVDSSGRYELFDSDIRKYVRVIVDSTLLPVSTLSDSITITALSGEVFATVLATKLLGRYRDPVSTVKFEIDLNNVDVNNSFLKPTDLIEITTDNVITKGSSGWQQEKIMLTSVRPDVSKSTVQVEAIQAKMYRKYGFIAPPSLPDYTSANDSHKEYCFIGDGSNMLNGGIEDGYFIW